MPPFLPLLLSCLPLAGAAVLAVLVATGGPIAAPGLWIDGLSATLLVLVAFLGAVVTGFSRRYLDGDPRAAEFQRGLWATLACVGALVAAGHLAVFALAWIGTSLSLHRLLVFRRDRPAARLAARKKFLFGRLADAALVGAFLLIAAEAGTARIDGILAIARTAPGWAHGDAIAALLVFAAMVKCAQFPFHDWLPEVMEAPTPVSALLHAGVINAGGFLAMRFAPVIADSAPALSALVVVGTFTALFATAVMVTQPHVKVALAWSTCAQMGFMLMQCGLGAFAAAALHLVAHSLYKAQLFLASGTLPARDARADAATTTAAPGARAAGVALLGAAAVGLAASPPAAVAGWPTGAWPLALVFALALAPAGARSTAGLVARALGLAALYAAGSWAAHHVLGRTLDVGAAAGAGAGAAGALSVIVVAAFALAAVVATLGPWLKRQPAIATLRVHVANGFYVNAWLDRALRAR